MIEFDGDSPLVGADVRFAAVPPDGGGGETTAEDDVRGFAGDYERAAVCAGAGGAAFEIGHCAVVSALGRAPDITIPSLAISPDGRRICMRSTIRAAATS